MTAAVLKIPSLVFFLFFWFFVVSLLYLYFIFTQQVDFDISSSILEQKKIQFLQALSSAIYYVLKALFNAFTITDFTTKI